MSNTASLRLNEKDLRNIEDLKKAYNISNTSELIRVLIRKDHDNLMSFEGLNKLSDKQIITLGLYKNCNTSLRKGKE